MRVNEAESRFELDFGEHTAYADFRRESAVLVIDYVFAPPELRGTGAAGKLMQEIVNYATTHQLDIHPVCGYAASWLMRHGK